MKVWMIIANCFVTGILAFGQETDGNYSPILDILGDFRSPAEKYSADVCYPEIGCFQKTAGLTKHIALLPDYPEKIDTTFTLYRKEFVKSPKQIHYLSSDGLNNIPRDKPLKIICHGFNASPREGWIVSLTDLFTRKEDASVIVIDWTKGSKSPNYFASVVNAELVGRQIARLVQRIQKSQGLSEDLVHFIGFSLGAQVGGFFGEYLKNTLNTTVARITGLDPAFFQFEGYFHIDKAHAKFVDVIHTSGTGNLLMGGMGMWSAVGHVDFYPNGGKDQPGCPPKLFTNCKHFRAHEFFVESYSSSCPFTAYPCPGGWGEFKAGKCHTSDISVTGRLGYYSQEAKGRGILYLETSASSPFCKE